MATFSKIIYTIDSHTAGEGTRLVTGGLPLIPGVTMAEKMRYAQEHLAWLPPFLLQEPRGHKDLYGALLVPPSDPKADAGIIFMDNQVFEPMCGHAVIGAVTSLIEMGMIAEGAPSRPVALDTPAGLIRAWPAIRQGKVVEVSFENVPSFLYRKDVEIGLPDGRTVWIDIAFGGNFFALVDVTHQPLELTPGESSMLAEEGMYILEAVNRQVEVKHPILPYIDRVIDLRFFKELPGRPNFSRNVVILGNRMIDRSPCGTGTAAELAMRFQRGLIKTGERFTAESILGTRFTAEVVAQTIIGVGSESLPGIIPRLTGNAYLTGLHQFVLQEKDPFPVGFHL